LLRYPEVIWSLMSPCRARAGSSLALVLVLVCSFVGAGATGARAQSYAPVPTFWFAGTQLIFARADRVDDEIAVRGSDPGLRRFLARVGATLSWEPSSRYVVVTTADRRTLTFTLGVPHFQTSAGGEDVPLRAYIDGGDVYLPFLTLARALYVRPILEGNEYILQPQIGSLDARADGRKTVVRLVGATRLRFTKTVDTPDRLTLTFAGTASTLGISRAMEMPGLGRVDVVVTGTARNPATSITFESPAGSSRAMLPSTNKDELDLAFAPQDVALGGMPISMTAAATTAATTPAAPPAPLSSAAAAPLPVASAAVPTPAAQATVAVVTGMDVENPAPDALLIHIAASQGIPFEWHRLGIDRFYIDFTGATLTAAPHEDNPGVAFVQSYRINQLQSATVPTVRVALTLTPNRRIDVIPDGLGVTITIADVDAETYGGFVAQVGTGTTGGANVAVVPTATPTPPGMLPVPPGAIPPPGSNPRLIVLDPGHGGSDFGAMHNGLIEKNLTLDIALRVRDLLVARGWIVKMTRDTDRDVYGWNASDVDELQARVDVANNAGARLFVSIHANSSASSMPNGTTSYYYKPEDRPLASAIQRRLIALLGTKDDGVVRERFYVIRHTTMPAALIETAFVSNAADAARLKSPDFRQQIALGIADGIKDYVGQPASAVSEQQ
jgi:N-acetylmuramoyl-L-alanine amidase